MIDVLKLLESSDCPVEDQKTFLKAQVVFWLIGATDGHAKNFSIFLGPRGRFRLAPLYDVLTALPALETRQILKKQLKLAMSTGQRNHYQIAYIQKRHFVQTVERAGLPGAMVEEAFNEIAATAADAIARFNGQLPRGFPKAIPKAVEKGLRSKLPHP